MAAGAEAWRLGPVPQEWTVQQQVYMERWARYDGTLFEGMADANSWAANQPAIYANTKLLWKHIEAVVDFYAGVIYQGALSTDGGRLPGGIPNAIPFDPQTGSDASNATLLAATSELFSAWNWQQQMSLRPMYASALGDCLVELVDDTDRRFIFPKVVWPGYVKDIELDYVGNVRAYTLEYRVDEFDDKKQKTGSYTYRKEVDGNWFRYFRDETETRADPNPYGFVPAIWDRHRIAAPDAVRGKSATDGTRQTLLQLNSLFGHSLDFQHKAFELPPMVASDKHGKATESPGDVSTPPSGRTLAERWRYRKVGADAKLLQPDFDVGKTLEMIKAMQDGILSENPEASFYQQLREMQMVTAPGAERLMGDVKNRVDLARAGYDAQTVKLFQMAIAMCGMRANDSSESGWKYRTSALDRRRAVFAPFNLDSYAKGDLDMSILPRPIIQPTEQERMEIRQLKVQVLDAEDQITSEWALKELYPELSKTELTNLVNERKQQQAERNQLLEDWAPVEDSGNRAA